MLNSVCKAIDYLFNSAKIAKSAQQEMIELRREQRQCTTINIGAYDNAAKGVFLVDGRRRALFNKFVMSMPKAKRVVNGSRGDSQFVTAKTLYAERDKQNQIVVKFSRKEQIVICANGTWHVKGDK